MNIDMSRLASIDIIVETIRASCDISLYCTYVSYSAFILFDRWLDEMGNVVSADTPLKGDEIFSWAAYHADQQPRHPDPGSSVALTSLLPLFYDQAKSVAMIRHSMDVIWRAVDILNPSQIPIITVDQPLYTLANQMEMAGNAWRRSLRHPVWWPPYRDGSPENSRKPSRWQWVDKRSSPGRCCYALNSRLILDGSSCDTHSTGSPGHSQYSAYSSAGRLHQIRQRTRRGTKPDIIRIMVQTPR